MSKAGIHRMLRCRQHWLSKIYVDIDTHTQIYIYPFNDTTQEAAAYVVNFKISNKMNSIWSNKTKKTDFKCATCPKIIHKNSSKINS